jgi:hypothetical protein
MSPSTTKQKPSQNPKTVITGKRLGNPKTQSWVIFVKDSIAFAVIILFIVSSSYITQKLWKILELNFVDREFADDGIQQCCLFCIHNRHICSCNGCPRNCSSWIPLRNVGCVCKLFPLDGMQDRFSITLFSLRLLSEVVLFWFLGARATFFTYDSH